MSTVKTSARLTPDQACGLFVQRLAREQAQKLHEQKAGVMAGKDPEAVHDARVATRRIRSVLYFFRPWLPKQPTTRLRKGVRAAGGVLGAVRDLDVSMSFVHTWAPRLAPAAEKPLLRNLQAQRQIARLDLLAFYKNRDYKRLQAALAEFMAAPLAETAPLAQVLPGLIGQANGEIENFFDTLHPPPPIEHLHALRINVKRFRYLLEFTGKRASPAVASLLQGLIAMQELLGNLHDADMGCHLAYSLLRQHDRTYTGGDRAALLTYGSGLAAERDRLTAMFLADDPAISPWAAWRQLPVARLIDETLGPFISDPAASADGV